METKVIEEVIQLVAMDNVTLSNLVNALENELQSILFIFSNFTKEVKDKDENVEKKLTELLLKISIEPKIIIKYYEKLKHLMGVKFEVRKEDNQIRMELLELQTIFLPTIKSLQRQIQKAKDLVSTLDVSAMDNMVSLTADINE